MLGSLDSFDLLSCLNCCSGLKKEGNTLTCASCGAVYQLDSNIVFMDSTPTKLTALSQNKWEQWYQKILQDGSYEEEYLNSYQHLCSFDFVQFMESKNLCKNDVYLEIGCGQFYHGLFMASQCRLVIGVDFSPSALKIAQSLFKARGITNYLLIQADISKLPLKSNSVDFIFGGGVLEHFDNTRTTLDELSRVLKSGGVCLNTVPVVNIASLTYRQIWGNIPDIPIVRELFKLVHIKLLKSRHLVFGYERSFWIPNLKKLHLKAAFSKIKVKRYRTDLRFAFLPEYIRPLCRYLSENSILFWPMAVFEAQK